MQIFDKICLSRFYRERIVGDYKMKEIDRKQLKQQAHQLNPVVMIGQHGLTPAVHLEIERALLAHELIKIKINISDRETRQSIIAEICKEREAHLIQAIGKVAVIYREKPEKEKVVIKKATFSKRKPPVFARGNKSRKRK